MSSLSKASSVSIIEGNSQSRGRRLLLLQFRLTFPRILRENNAGGGLLAQILGNILNFITEEQKELIMSNLTCELLKPLGSFDDIPKCEFQFLRALSQSLEKFRPAIFVQDRTKSVKAIVSEEIKSLAGQLSFNLTESLDLTASTYPGRPHANLRIDFFLRCKCSSAESHIFGLEICLDNRIVMGTNVAKALSLQSKYPGSDTVFLTLERDLLDSGGWDPAYADSEIYYQDIFHFYSEIVTGQLTILSVGVNR